MAPAAAKIVIKDFRASFRKKKLNDTNTKIDKAKQLEEEENKKLIELKDNLDDNLLTKYSDFDLLGFLRARSFNIKDAEDLVKLDMNTKYFLQMEDFLYNYESTDIEKSYSVSGLIGPDKEGSLVRVINVGYSDVKGYMHALSSIENLKSLVWFLEKDLKLQGKGNNKHANKKIQMSYLVNLDRLSLNKLRYKPAMDTCFVGLKLLQDFYHDAVKTIYVINAPSYFSSALKLFKPAIQDSLNKKIKVLDGDGKAQLLKYIDGDKLPACFGGAKLDSKGDPFCKEFIGWGGPIPEDFHFTSDDFLSADDPDVICATVPANSFYNYRFVVPKVGCFVQYHIQSKENDIRICVYKRPFNDTDHRDGDANTDEDVGTMEPIVPFIRSQCHIAPEIGSTISWFSGVVVVHFDNTYSWMNSKQIMMKFSVTPPE